MQSPYEIGQDFAFKALGIQKIAAAKPIALLDEVVKRIPPSMRGGLFPSLPFDGVWRRKTLQDIAQKEGLPRAVKTYRQLIKHKDSFAKDLPLEARLKGFKKFKENRELSRAIPRRGKVMNDTAGRLMDGDEMVTLHSYGPEAGLKAALKEPASALDNAVYMPGSTRAQTHGLFFWEGDVPPVFTQSPRGLGDGGAPAKLTMQVPRSKIIDTGKHTEISSLGERVVPARGVLDHAQSASIERLTPKTAKVKSELKPHQKRVVDRLMGQQGLVVAHGLGSGKTLSSIAAAEALGMPTAVLVPASLQKNYEKEIKKHTDKPPKDMSVGSLQRAILRGEMPDKGLLIIDEAHRIRDPGTKGNKVVNKSTAEKRLLLTASPVYNHPSDIAPLVNIVAGKKLLPSGKSDFAAKFVKMEKVDPSWFASTFRGITPGERPVLTNTSELSPILRKWVDYHENKTTGDDFPDRKEQFIHVPMSEKQQDTYDALLDQAPSWLKYKVQQGLPPSKQEASLINSFMTTQRQVSGSIKPFVAGMSPQEAVPHAAKANEAFKRFKGRLSSNSDHKAVVYSNYLEAGLEPYEELLKASKIPYGVFTGKVKKKERDQMVTDYNDGKLKALLVSSAGGEGLDLKGTRQIQVLDPHWNDEKIEQVIGRGIRYKSHAHLPKEQQKVDVERYLATQRPGFLRSLFGMKPTDQTADQYLQMLSSDKKKLNEQLRDLLRKKT